MTSVFVSYSRKDKAVADYIAAELRRFEADVFVDYERLNPGKFNEQLGREIRERDFFVLLVSAYSMSSEWVNNEVEWAWHNGKKNQTIPLMLEDINFPDRLFFLVNLERVDFTGWAKGDNSNINAGVGKLLRLLGLEEQSTSQANRLNIEASASLAELITLRQHFDVVTALTFSPNPNHILLASGSRDKSVKLWEIPTGQLRFTFSDHKSEVRSLAFSSKGSRLFSIAVDGFVRIWETATGRRQNSFQCRHDSNSQILCMAVSPNDETLASGSDDGSIKLWNIMDGSELVVLRGHRDKVLFLSFSPDHQLLASASDDRTVRLWRLTDMREVAALTGGEGAAISLEFSKDSLRLASSWAGANISIWDINTCQIIGPVLEGHKEAVTSVAFSPNDSLIASGSWDRTVRLWDVTSGNDVSIGETHNDAIAAVAFSPDGSYIASGSNDKTVKLWTVP